MSKNLLLQVKPPSFIEQMTEVAVRSWVGYEGEGKVRE